MQQLLSRLLMCEHSSLRKTFHGVEQHRGVFFQFLKSHGAVRYGLFFSGIVRCGAVWFSTFSKQYGAVHCGRYPERWGKVRNTYFQASYGAVR